MIAKRKHQARSIAMDEEHFRLWQTLLESRTGINLPPQRKQFLESKVSLRMQEIDCLAYEDYFQQLTNDAEHGVEWVSLVDRLTVQETRFYRHQPSYRLVEGFTRQRLLETQQKVFNVWSVGCSTGEEPYSLAMQLESECNAAAARIYWSVTGTDISLHALSSARRGIYNTSKMQFVGESMRDEYFSEIAPGQFQVNSNLRDRVCFASANAHDLKNVPLHDMDIIFCQNLLIYFRRWRKRQVISALAERLRPGGLLVLGVSEMVDRLPSNLERIKTSDTLAFIRKAES